jgi:hypothetical protein
MWPRPRLSSSVPIAHIGIMHPIPTTVPIFPISGGGPTATGGEQAGEDYGNDSGTSGEEQGMDVEKIGVTLTDENFQTSPAGVSGWTGDRSSHPPTPQALPLAPQARGTSAVPA